MNGVQILLRWLGLETAAERAESAAMRVRGLEIARQAAPETRTDEEFERQRAALSLAVRDGEVDEDTAKDLLAEIDLRQAAGHTTR